MARGFWSRVGGALQRIFAPAPEPEYVEPEEEPTGPYEPEEPEYVEPEDIDEGEYEPPIIGGGPTPDRWYPEYDPDIYERELYREGPYEPEARSAYEEYSYLVGSLGITEDPYAQELMWYGWFAMEPGGRDRLEYYMYTGTDPEDFDWFDWREWYEGGYST
jgi:hypothetical protein